jgi:hypothetical protein
LVQLQTIQPDIIYGEIRAQSQKRRPLLGNRSVNMLPWQPNYVIGVIDTHKTTEVLLEGVFSVGSLQRLYKYNEI